MELRRNIQAWRDGGRLLGRAAARFMSPVDTQEGADAARVVRALAEVLRRPPGQAGAVRGRGSTEEIVAAAVEQWFGSAGASADTVVAGLAALVAARQPGGMKVPAMDQWVRDRLAEGTTVSALRPDADSAARGSFVNYLLATAGPRAVTTFLESFDPDRRETAAVTAFGRPLPMLEEAWLMRLGPARVGAASAFRSMLVHLWPLLKPHWKRQLEVFLYMLLELAYTLALPLTTRYVFDHVLPTGRRTLLLEVIGGLVVVYVLDIAIAMRRALVTVVIEQSVTVDLQERMLVHLQRLSHSFYGRAKVGDVLSRFTADVADVDRAIATVGGVGIYLVLTALAAGVTLLILSPLLGVVVIALLPAFAMAYLSLRARLRAASLERQQRTGEAAAHIQESMLAHAVVKAFGLEERMIAGYRGRLHSLRRGMLNLARLGVVFEASTLLAVSFGQLVVLGFGGYLTIKHELTLGTLVAFIGLLPSLIGPVSQLSNLSQIIQGASGSFQRITGLLEETVDIEDRPGAQNLQRLQKGISIRKVSFAYVPGQQALIDLNLDIPAGSHVAVVGPSGSGKSTLAHLLLRFWDPTDGAIIFDGIDLRDATLASLRSQIGLVPQDTFIFDTTIHENIALGRAQATDEEVRAAARAAELEDYVRALPAGYDTLVGERGLRMSGGQRQRLGIARALLRDPQVLVLDEATSALDTHTEAGILRTLDRVGQGRTRVTITHRLAMAEHADIVVVLDGGRIVEQGSAEELRVAGGLYQRLWEEQGGGVAV